MAVYVLFGGAWGAGMGGIVKLILLYVASVLGFILVMSLSGGFGGLYGQLKQALVGTDLGSVQSSLSLSNITSDADLKARFLNLVARGPFKDIGSGISLLLGVLSTQTYAQAVLSGKSTASAKRGALLSACLIPPLGIAGILIGLYMRGNFVTQAEVDALTSAGLSVPDGMGVIASTIQVFPAFVVQFMPKLVGGIVLGTLLISIVGGGAGLSLGVATILVKDIYGKFVDYSEYSDEGAEYVFDFDVFKISTDGDLLDSSKVFYNVFVDGEPYTFYSDMYDVEEDITDIPFGYSTDYDFYNYDGTTSVELYCDGFDTVGVQTIYRPEEGKEIKSDLIEININTGEEFTNGVTGVNNIAVDKAVKSEVYYDLTGRRVVNPENGLFIKKVTFNDNTVKVSKIAK
jgi:hypothetical protein